MSLHIFPVNFKQDITPESDLVDILISSNDCGIEDGDIIVVSQKIVSKQEGRAVNLDTVIPSELSIGIASAYDKDPKLVEAILSEAKRIVRMEHGVIIVQTKHGFVCANAGIDESNVDGNYVTLLPKDPDNSARLIRDGIRTKSGKKVAVIISDTFGKILRVTAIAIVDELCAAAELVMGKTKKSPMAIIKNYQFDSKDDQISNLIRPGSDDLFK